MNNINTKSISELEGWKWNDVIPSEMTHSRTELRFYELHDKPISELELSDIRFLIGQNYGLIYLVPIAINFLKENIFLEADYYPGDLLSSLLQINNEPNYWLTHLDEKESLITLYNSQRKNIKNIDGISDETIIKLKEEFLNFTSIV
jgi:hypothetical protein